MSTAVFTDLDGTLIYSARDIGDAADITVVEHIDGAPAAWMTTGAAAALERLNARAHVVPTSTRVLEQYLRLHLPGGTPEYAILANGGRLLHHGADDISWAERIGDPSWGTGHPGRVAARLTHHLDARAWVRSIRHFDRIVCVTSHRGATPADADVEYIAAVAEEYGYRAFPQGRKTHLIPTHITKEAAAAEVATRLRVTRTLAAGDHELDAGLLRWADTAIRPAHGCEVDGVPATASTGVRAGEEILAFLADSVAAG